MLIGYNSLPEQDIIELIDLISDLIVEWLTRSSIQWKWMK